MPATEPARRDGSMGAGEMQGNTMKGRIASFLLFVALAAPALPGAASAQGASPFGPAPGQAPSSNPFGPAPGQAPAASPFGPPPNAAQAVCSKFPALREAAEKAGKHIEAAGKRKAPPPELCKAFTAFTAAEAKMIKFLVDNRSLCGVPEQAIKQAQAGHAKATEIRTKICAAAAAPPQARGPSLSDALSTPVVPSADNTKTGRGTYDTLTGNALTR